MEGEVGGRGRGGTSGGKGGGSNCVEKKVRWIGSLKKLWGR